MKKNLLFTWITACFPGFGQMYYGYMRRGTSLALWFWGVIFVSSFWGMGPLGLVLPVIWAYSFFDTFNIRSLSPEQYAAFGDDYLPNSQWLKQMNLEKLMSGGRRKVLGWALIIFGGILLYNTLFSRLVWRLYDYIPFLASLIELIPSLFIAGVVILLGLYVLRGKKVSLGKFGKKEDEADFTGWQPSGTPPTGQPQQPTAWDVRQSPAPAPTWDYSTQAAAAAPQAAPAEPVAPVAPVAPAEPVLEAPFVPAPPSADIVLSLDADAPPVADLPTEAAQAEEAVDSEGEEAKEEAPAPGEAATGEKAEEDTEKKSTKKGKKKETGEE